MFNNFNLKDKEIVKILNDYKPLILKYSIIDGKIDEDLQQEIEIVIYQTLSRNRKK